MTALPIRSNISIIMIVTTKKRPPLFPDKPVPQTLSWEEAQSQFQRNLRLAMSHRRDPESTRPEPNPLKSELEYESALKRIDVLMSNDPEPTSIVGAELELMIQLVEDYENEHYPI